MSLSFPRHPLNPPTSLSAQAREPGFDIATLYREAHQRQVATGQLVTALHIGAEHTAVATGLNPASPSVVLTLALGSQKTAREFFRSTTPTPLELESAIAWVEDEVYSAHVRHRPWVPEGAVVTPSSTDPALHEIATLAGVAQGAVRVLPLEAMEHLFHRFAAVAQGRPAAHEGLPASPAFTATLVVLRELMHHMPFAAIVLTPTVVVEGVTAV
jgi:exopolyphosphatase/pppGpp-phosphohydrolase